MMRCVEAVYAASSSCGGGSSSRSSSLHAADGCPRAAKSCCCGSAHYKEVRCDKATTLLSVAERRLYRRLCGVRWNSVVVTSSTHIHTRSNWKASSLLCCVSALLAACSLSSLATCIALTGLSLSCINMAHDTAPTSTAEGDFGRDGLRVVAQAKVLTEPLLRPPLQDCVAHIGRARCRSVQKAESSGEGSFSGASRQIRHSMAAVRALADGVYFVSAQVAGTAWQAPPSLLRVVIARVPAKAGAVNVTVVHSMSVGVGGGGDAFAAAGQRGAFSVYTAASVRLKAGDELTAQVVCVEEPDCVVHVNGTASHLTLERFN